MHLYAYCTIHLVVMTRNNAIKDIITLKILTLDEAVQKHCSAELRGEKSLYIRGKLV